MNNRPNFVIIMTDTQGANCTGTYANNKQLCTPCIDKLAEDGIKFNRAYTTCPVCTPARSGIFTGMYPHINGAWANDLSIGQSIFSMGERFQEEGYQTTYIGKWHLDGHDYFGNGKCPNGWDEEYWYDGLNYLEDLNDNERAFWRPGLQNKADLVKHNITKEFTWANRCSQRAEKFLKTRNKEEPFVLVVSYDEPHDPYVCPPEYYDKFKDFELDLGTNAYDDLNNKPEHHRRWAESVAKSKKANRYLKHDSYFACNSFVDSEIGSVIDMVEKYADENTYIIYTSDHGSMLGAHGLFGKGPVMYNEITKIPFIIKTPDKTQSFESDKLVSHVDILPTMLELAGARVPEILDGKSLVKDINQKEDTENNFIVVEFNRFSADDDNTGAFIPVRCILKNNLKLVINMMSTDELYDLSKDKEELNNLIDDINYAKERNEMHEDLIKWMKERRDPFSGYYFATRKWNQIEQPWDGGYIYRPEETLEVGFRDYLSAKVTNKSEAHKNSVHNCNR